MNIYSVRDLSRTVTKQFRDDLDQNSISRIETGKRIVADYELKSLAHVLSVPVDALIADSDPL